LPEFLYFALVQLSLFALGTTVVAAVVLVVKRPPRWWAYVLVKVGVFLVLGIIFLLVLPDRVVEPGVFTYLYLMAVAAIGVGLIFESKDIIQRAIKPPLSEP
jgi:hypothetical protein